MSAESTRCACCGIVHKICTCCERAHPVVASHFTCPRCLRVALPARFESATGECTDCAKEAEGRHAGPLPPPPVVLTEPGPFFITPEPPDDEPDAEGEDGA